MYETFVTVAFTTEKGLINRAHPAHDTLPREVQMQMTWEQKFEASGMLGSISLKMRAPGDWYVSHIGVSIIKGIMLHGGCVTNAKTPEEAVLQHWQWLTTYKPGEYIACSDLASGERRNVVWAGYMWKDFK